MFVCLFVSPCARVFVRAPARRRCVFLSVCVTPRPRFAPIVLLFASIYATESSSSAPVVHFTSFLSLTCSPRTPVSVLTYFFCVFRSFVQTELQHLYTDVCICACMCVCVCTPVRARSHTHTFKTPTLFSLLFCKI